jgi:hypothetical protein
LTTRIAVANIAPAPDDIPPIPAQPRDMLDRDEVPSGRSADGPHPDRATRTCIHFAESGVQRRIGRTPVEFLNDLIELDTQRVGDHADLTLEFAHDDARQGDERLGVHGLTETESVWCSSWSQR